MYKLYLGDCLDIMNEIDDKSIDMILCDLPYGSTACKWDIVIPFQSLWEQYNRIIKPNGAICLFGREPFTSLMITSNIKNYRHKWIWNKKQSGSFQNAKYMPLQIDEDIIVFSNKKCNYYPIMREGKYRKRGGAIKSNRAMHKMIDGYTNFSNLYFPVNIYELANPRNHKLHPTQKPVPLCEYLIRTYTRENEMILDNCMGVGTTIKAAENVGRNSIGIEKDKDIFNTAKEFILS